jgi:peptidylprolyl isomerase
LCRFAALGGLEERIKMSSRFLVSCAVLAMFAAPAFAQKDDDEKSAGPTPMQILDSAPAEDWRSVDPENMLLMDLPQGLVVIEMRPDFAPNHVQRIKELARAGFYNGLNFHRVIEGFVAQGGDPKGDGSGGSDKPDLKAEFERDTEEVHNFTVIGRDRVAARVGFADGVPVAAQPESLRSFREDRKVELWGLHCPGMMSMARKTEPDTANSQFFLLIGDSRLSLDRRYSLWGWIIDGFENTRRIARGEPPDRPTPIMRVRIGADLPAAQRPNVQIMKTDSETFKKWLDASGAVKDGFVRDMCAVKAPRKVDGKVEL